MNLWRRFRQLPGAAQAATWLGVAAVYTVGLVLVLGGGDTGSDSESATGDGTTTAKPLDAEERKVAAKVERVKVKVAEPNDVAAFRKPNVEKVDCADGRCVIDYTSGLPGRGRIFEDQQAMLARIFEDASIDDVTLRVFRGSTVGPGTPAKATEETTPGTPILVTRCVRSDDAKSADAGEDAKVPAVPAECESLPLSQGGNNANSGAPQENRPEQGDGGDGILGGG